MPFKNNDKVIISDEGYNLMAPYFNGNMIPRGIIGTVRTVGAYNQFLNMIPPGWYYVIFDIPAYGDPLNPNPRDYSVRGLTINENYLLLADAPNFTPPSIPDTTPNQSQAVKQVYIATVQIVLDPVDGHTPEDIISEILSESSIPEIIDWQYAKHGGQYLKPTSTFVPKDYSEGDAFQ